MGEPHGIPHLLACPRCGTCDVDLRAYRSLMALSSELAFFTLDCPRCGARISTIQPIPSSLRDQVEFAAIEVGAGMGEGT